MNISINNLYNFMTNENQTTPVSDEELKIEEEKKQRANVFMVEYQELCKKHGFGLQAVAQWAVVEVPKQEAELETAEEVIKEPAITEEVKDEDILDN